MSGTARLWIETVPESLSLEEHIASFKEQFNIGGDSCRSALMAEFWERRQRADEKTADYIEQKARLARRLNIPDKQFTVEATTQGMRDNIHRDVVLQNLQTIKALYAVANIADSSARRTGGNPAI